MITVAAYAARAAEIAALAGSMGIEPPPQLRAVFVAGVAPYASRLPHLARVAELFETDGQRSFDDAIGHVILTIVAGAPGQRATGNRAARAKGVILARTGRSRRVTERDRRRSRRSGARLRVSVRRGATHGVALVLADGCGGTGG
jgi:hypothetical protein